MRFGGVFVFTCAAVGVTASSESFGQCNATTPQTALIDLGTGTYQTHEGGLYAGGGNQRPAAHELAGRAMAESIAPLNTHGAPASNGRIVMISIGFSNMTQEWASGANGDPPSIALTFRSKAIALQSSGVVNPAVLIVDGAQGAQSSANWAATPPNLGSAPWTTPLTRLSNAGATTAQVQVVALKCGNPGPNTCMSSNGSTTGEAGIIASQYAAIARNLKTVFPNVKLCFISCRTYAGYALTAQNPEPYAYEQAFGIKWVIDAQIQQSGAYGNLNFDSAAGPVVAPWLSWGAYLWANGTTPNGQGLAWDVNDFRPDDRTHPSGSGVDKVGTAFLNFFLADAATRPWFGWQCLHGDSNADGIVNGGDIAPFVNVLMNPSAASTSQQCLCDANNDGVVDDADAAAMVALLLSAN